MVLSDTDLESYADQLLTLVDDLEERSGTFAHLCELTSSLDGDSELLIRFLTSPGNPTVEELIRSIGKGVEALPSIRETLLDNLSWGDLRVAIDQLESPIDHLLDLLEDLRSAIHRDGGIDDECSEGRRSLTDDLGAASNLESSGAGRRATLGHSVPGTGGTLSGLAGIKKKCDRGRH